MTVIRAGTRQLVARAAERAARSSRQILGITGPPGAGKSTLAAILAEQLGPTAVVVPMDGFHLANVELDRLGRRNRKGAPDTFDSAGYVAMLERLRRQDDDTVYAPRFVRDLDEAIVGAIPVPAGVRLVITEGNYLLLDAPPWSGLSEHVDEVWYLDVDDERRVARLIDRHIRHGRSPSEARRWVERSDEANARLIEATRSKADVVVRWLED